MKVNRARSPLSLAVAANVALALLLRAQSLICSGNVIVLWTDWQRAHLSRHGSLLGLNGKAAYGIHLQPVTAE